MIYRITLLSIIICTISLFNGCDEDRVFNAYEGNRELEEGESVPFLLYQNYPNPFNPATIIMFEVVKDMPLKMTVYSEEWQPVNELLNAPTSAGRYSIEFNAESENLPSGDYYYTMEGDGHIQIRKMKVLK